MILGRRTESSGFTKTLDSSLLWSVRFDI
jgi:hypothetical protein